MGYISPDVVILGEGPERLSIQPEDHPYFGYGKLVYHLTYIDSQGNGTEQFFYYGDGVHIPNVSVALINNVRRLAGGVPITLSPKELKGEVKDILSWAVNRSSKMVQSPQEFDTRYGIDLFGDFQLELSVLASLEAVAIMEPTPGIAEMAWISLESQVVPASVIVLGKTIRLLPALEHPAGYKCLFSGIDSIRTLYPRVGRVLMDVIGDQEYELINSENFVALVVEYARDWGLEESD